MDVARYNELDAIFIGRLAHQEVYGHKVRFTFSVSKWYQGRKANPNELAVVVAPLSPSDCGFGLLNDTSHYLVYATAYHDTLFTSRCMSLIDDRTKLPSDYRADTTLLGMLQDRIKKVGSQSFLDKDGALLAKGTYKNGLPVGRWEFYRNGKLIDVGHYSSTGLKDSIWTNYRGDADGGSAEIRRMYVNGKLTPWEKYYTEGKLWRDVYPVKDFDGPWIEEIYHNNGKLRVRMRLGPPRQRTDGLYESGLMNGLCQDYDQEGHLVEEGQYYQGLPLGPQKFYDKKGKLIKTEPGRTKPEMDGLPKRR